MCTGEGEGIKSLSFEVPQWYNVIEELFRYIDISVSLVKLSAVPCNYYCSNSVIVR